ncbi:B-cell receptor-associated protein 29 isoform X1 [Perca flavescens]|nr:B-cell receptor-associated protein 29-like isoform X1 [Perca flavescens]XP_028441185.1 B-cell receptor-associated protein 29-like isoform X1 [Perca flavescens]XP_028441186.1 B-cell receptor-associated protein 29-like isoform X1 [Perca flavescens]
MPEKIQTLQLQAFAQAFSIKEITVTMTLQWTAVAFFLYAEIVVNLILCIPFISARRWRSVFSWRIWNWLSPYWNKCFVTMIMVLIVLFLDAVREVQKYSGPEPMHDAKVNPNLYDNVHMKLFRAQRNLYISGFSLFLWLIMRRIVTLLNQVAITVENSSGLQAQMDSAVKAAKQHQDDNLMLKQALLDEEQSMSAKTQQMKLEADKLADQVKAAEEAVRKSHAEVEAMRRQAKGLAHEYDRLLREHHQLQNLQSPADKKDQ